jgi:adenylylsulfate kinase
MINMYDSCVIWITGLSAAGKTTIATALSEKLVGLGHRVQHLDGDLIRKIFPGTGYTREERDKHVKRIGHLSSMLEKHDVFVVASFISPYREARAFVRSQCKKFLEVYVSTPLAECEKRDPKGLYKKARKGEITNFTGINDPYEPPENPEIEIDTTGISVEDAVNIILNYLEPH